MLNALLFFQKIGLLILIFWLLYSFYDGSGSKSDSGAGRQSVLVPLRQKPIGSGSTYLRMWATCSVLEENVSSVPRISSVMVFNTDLMVSEGKYPLITTQSISEIAKNRIREETLLKKKNTMVSVGVIVSYFYKQNPPCQKSYGSNSNLFPYVRLVHSGNLKWLHTINQGHIGTLPRRGYERIIRY